MTGKLSTHVLDLSTGRPAAGVVVELWRHADAPAGPVRLKSLATNADGRTDQPLLAAAEMAAGRYELVFAVRAYFTARGVASPFLDRVTVAFEIADAAAPYHVPLLVAPGGYSTYRGS